MARLRGIHAIASRRIRASTLASANMARIRINTMAPNNSENPSTVRPSGHSNSGAILLPPVVMLAAKLWSKTFLTVPSSDQRPSGDARPAVRSRMP